jgi:uncharacterized membrane protein YdbT with pleckstrin-like domain
VSLVNAVAHDGHHQGVARNASDLGTIAAALYWLIALVALAVLFVGLLKILCTRIRIRQGRLQVRRGVFAREWDNIDLWRITNIALSQTLLNRLTGDGTLVFTLSYDQAARSAQQTPEAAHVITGLARGKELAALHQNLLNAATLLRGSPILKGIIQ